MIGAAEAAPPPKASLAEQHAALRSAAHQLEGVFLAQLFHAMRETVPQDSGFGGGEAAAMFQSMQDDQLARQAAEKSVRGLGDALYRQLSRHLAPLDSAPGGATAPPATR